MGPDLSVTRTNLLTRFPSFFKFKAHTVLPSLPRSWALVCGRQRPGRDAPRGCLVIPKATKTHQALCSPPPFPKTQYPGQT